MNLRSYLVSGASTGIGRACIDELARAGAKVWATVRTDDAEAALRRDHPDAVTVLRMDVADPASVRAAGERVCAAGPLHGLINNAGVAIPSPLEHVPLDAFRRQIEVNLVGQLAVTQAMLPALRQARAREEPARILMVGSIGGRIAAPMLGPYHVSKFGLVGLADTLRAELAPAGIPVILVEPGAVATPIWDRGASAASEIFAQMSEAALRQYASQINKAQADSARAARRGLPPSRAAQIIVKALTGRHSKPRYLIGTDARAAAMIGRLPYRLLYRLTAARQ